jgi:hypothetical protein
VLAREQRKENPCTLLVGMWIIAAFMKNSMEILTEIKNRTTIWPRNHFSGIRNHYLIKISVLPYSLHHYLQQPRYGNNLSARKWTNG